MTTPVLGLTELSNTSGERSTIIDTVRVLDAINGNVPTANININTPPAAPSDGEMALISSAPTGVFAGFPGHLAIYIGTGWQLIPPQRLGQISTSIGFYIPNGTFTGWINNTLAGNSVNIFTAAQVAAPLVLADGAVIDIDVRLGNTFYITLGGNRQVNFTNLAGLAGSIVNLHIIQDSTGGRTITWNNVNWGTLGSPVLSTGANIRDLVSFTVLSSGANVLGLPIVKGFSP